MTHSITTWSRTLFFAVATALVTFSCTVDMTIHSKDERPLAHVVLVWLKDPGSAVDRERIIIASKRLGEIEGVIQVRTGQSIPSERDVVDDSFDVGLYVELESPEALRAYATDPLHLSILKHDIAPVTERYIVYDFEIKL
ncbi:MAG: Dabb family protein [Gammaproteobacteria bacterium]